MTAHSTGQSPTVVTPCFTFFGGFTTQTRDMVVVSGGFRDRWQRQGLARQLDAENGQTDDLQQNLFGGCLEDQTGSPDESWNQVGFADVFESPAFDADDQSIAHMSFMDDSRSVFIKPKPKSRPQNSSSSSSSTLGIKRTADEFASHLLHRQMSDLKQPWQKGPLAAIFSKPKAPWERSPAGALFSGVGMADHISASDSAAAVPKQIRQMETTVQRIRTARFATTDDDYRRLSLSRYKTMVLLEVDATRLGLSLVTFAGTLCSSDDLAQIFNDVFAPKSSGTLLKRCNSMWRFSCWLQKKFLGSPFNQPEGVIYSYVCHLRCVEAGPTTPAQFIEALRFSNALLGFCKTELDVMLSARVVGAAHSIYLTKRVRRPAEVLTTSEVQELESICIRDGPLHHKVIAGHLIFCMMAAARWHDSMHVVSIELSNAGRFALLEAATAKHKSSRSKEQQRELLPFTALGQTLAEDCWAEHWMEARQQAQCERWPHFLCSWSEQVHGWTSSRMSTAEASCWLRELLEPAVGAARASMLTVHGLKATMLSWAAKSLLFSPEEQLALGHHVSSQYKSALIYSRDNQIGLCSKIHSMLEKIRQETFQPDNNRVQRLLQLTMDRAREMQEEDSDSSSSSSDASSVASSEGEHDGLMPSTFKRLATSDIDRDHCFINIKSKVIHLELVDQHKFWCGRSASSSFRKATREDLGNAEAVICASCSHSYKATLPAEEL